MPDAINPYHRWLGLSPAMDSPNHFQLLGVDPTLTSENEIANAVAAGVKRSVKLLSRIPPNQHRELQIEVRHRIKIARDTLLDPHARSTYAQSLTANPPRKPTPRSSNTPNDLVAPQRRSKKTTQGTAEQPRATTPVKPEKPKRRKPNNQKTSGLDSKTSSDVAPPRPKSGVDTARTAQQLSAQEIASAPLAEIPIAIPFDESSNASIPSPSAPLDSPPIRINTKIRKRRFSIVEFLMKAALVGILLGGAYLTYANFDALRKIADGSLVEPVSDLPPTNPSSGTPPNSATPTNPDAAPSTSKPKPTTSPKPSLPTQPKVDPENSPPTTPTGDPGPGQQDAADDQPVSPEIDDNDASDTDPLPVKTDPLQPVTLTNAQLRVLDRQFHGSWRSVLFRDKETFQLRIQQTDRWLRGDSDEEKVELVAHQKDVKKAFDVIEEINRRHDEFWEQVRTSSNAIVGNRVIEVGPQMLGFVEANNQAVLLRNEGTNIRYDFRFIPPGLAVALVESGEIDDTALWHLQLAAFYAIHRETSTSYAEKIKECLTVAEAGGYDGKFVRDFLEFQFDFLGPVDPKIDYLAVTEKKNPNRSKTLEAYRQQAGYVSADRIPNDRLKQIADELWNLPTASAEEEILVLDELLQVSINGGYVLLTDDVIYQLSRIASFDAADLRCRIYRTISKKIDSEIQRRSLVESGIRLLAEVKTSSKKPKKADSLYLELQQIAKRSDMRDVLRRLDQLNRPD